MERKTEIGTISEKAGSSKERLHEFKSEIIHEVLQNLLKLEQIKSEFVEEVLKNITKLEA